MAAKKSTTSAIFASLKSDLQNQTAQVTKEAPEETAPPTEPVLTEAAPIETSDAQETAGQPDDATITADESPAPQPPVASTAPTIPSESAAPEPAVAPPKKNSILAGGKARTARVARSVTLTPEADAKVQALKKQYELSVNEIINRIILAYED